VALASVALLLIFGLAMALSLGIKSSLDYSVFSASAGRAAPGHRRRDPAAVIPPSMRAPLDVSPAATPARSSSSTPTAHTGTGDWLLLLGPGLIWGASFLFIAEGLQSVGPNGLTFARILVGFVVLGLVPSARRPILREDRAKVALLGLVWLALPLSMFPLAEQRVSSALTGMLNGANPLLVAIVASAFSRRLPGRDVLLGLAVGLAGTVLVALPSLSLGGSSLDGVLFILAGVTCYGFALNLARPLQQRSGALPVIWRAQGWALLMTAPLGGARAAARALDAWPAARGAGPRHARDRGWPTCYWRWPPGGWAPPARRRRPS
jgi:hypothetical protein